MKKVALALVFGILTVGGVSAQTTKKAKVKSETDQNAKLKTELKHKNEKDHKQRTPEERAEIQAKRLRTQYNLNDVQTARIKEISLAKVTQMQSLKDKYSDNRKEMSSEMRTLKTNWENELKAVLTPEQYAQFQKERTEKMEKRQVHQGNQNGQMGKHKYKMKEKDDDDDND